MAEGAAFPAEGAVAVDLGGASTFIALRYNRNIDIYNIV